MQKANPTRRARSGPRVKLHVIGAAGEVTGSLNLFEYFDGNRVTRFIVDIGLHQEDEKINRRNFLPRGITPADIDFVIISHAHVDHSGLLPKFIQDGFKGFAYTHAATRDILTFLLPDSGHLQEAAADRINKRIKRQRAKSESKRPTFEVMPSYTEEDAENAIKRIKTLNYNQDYELADGVSVRLTEACHILGAAVVTITIGKGDNKKTVCFTGNIGRSKSAILKDLAPVASADYVITESTYGDKLHQKRDRLEVLAGIINAAHKRATEGRSKKTGFGKIIIPAFAVDRVPSLLYDLRELMTQRRIPDMPTFLDSPMAIAGIRVYEKHSYLYNTPAARLLGSGVKPFRTPRYVEVAEQKYSNLLDEKAAEPIIIVGSSGMAAGGRILNHIKHALPGKENTIIFVGYQGTGALGYELVNEKPREVRVRGDVVPVNAVVEYMSDFSGHADYEEMIAWMRGFTRKPKQTILVHGDPDSLTGFKKHIEDALGWSVVIPGKRQCFEL